MEKSLDSVKNVARTEDKPVLAVLVGEDHTLDKSQILAKAFATRAAFVNEIRHQILG